MAATSITVKSLDKYNTFATAADFADITDALDATDGAKFAMSERDDKYLVLIYNSNSTANAAAITTTIKGGNGLQGGNDITVSLANGKYSFVALDSGRFKNVSGDDKGKVVITSGNAYIEVAVFKLP